ncbi:MAG: acyl carrier protein [Chloroflexota bacterium]
MSDTEDKVRAIVTRILRCPEDVLTPTCTWKEVKADSLDLVQIVIATEDAFSIEIPDTDAEKFRNYGDFVDYVEGRVAAKS